MFAIKNTVHIILNNLIFITIFSFQILAMEFEQTQQLMNLLDAEKIIDEASTLEKMKNLVAAGANVHYADHSRSNLLHKAARHDCPAIIDYLIEQEVDAKAFTKPALTPLHIAAQHGNTKVIRRLLTAKVSIEAAVYPHYSAPLTVAIQHNQVNAAVTLINAGANIDSDNYEGFASLRSITKEFARELLLAGAYHITLVNKIVAPPFIKNICNRNKLEIAVIALRDEKQIFKEDERDGYQITALMYATAQGHTYIVRRLLARQAIILAQDKDSRTMFDILTNVLLLDKDDKEKVTYEKIARLCGKKVFHMLLVLETKLPDKNINIAHDIWLQIIMFILGSRVFALCKPST